MKTIPSTFTASGFVHELIERRGDVALFRRFAQGGGKEHFEVVRIRRHNGFKIPGTDKMAPPAETYPGNEKWGTDGITLPTIDAARAAFEEMASKLEQEVAKLS